MEQPLIVHVSVTNVCWIRVTILIMFINCFVNVATGQTPICKHRLITHQQKLAIMDYVNKATQNQWFPGDIGILQVREKVQPSGTVAWRVSSIIDNTYRNNPPREFAKVHSDIVLFYTENTLPLSATEKELINEQLDNIVLDRVYIRPPHVHRNDTLRLSGLISEKPLDVGGGQFRISDSRRHCMDNCDHAVGYLFKPGEEKFEVHETL